MAGVRHHMSKMPLLKIQTRRTHHMSKMPLPTIQMPLPKIDSHRAHGTFRSLHAHHLDARQRLDSFRETWIIGSCGNSWPTAQHRAWEAANPDRIRAYYINNRDRVKAYQRAYHAANSDRINAQRRAKRAARRAAKNAKK